MILLRLPIILLITCSFSAVSVGASEIEMQNLLSKMNNTLERGNYEGTFVFMHNGNVETMSIVHGYSDNGVREKLVSLTGDAREVIRDQDVLTCIWPRDKLVVIEAASEAHGLPSSLPTDINELAFHYKLTDVGQARVAGHNCTLVRFEPLDDLRYGGHGGDVASPLAWVGRLRKGAGFESASHEIASMISEDPDVMDATQMDAPMSTSDIERQAEGWSFI